MRRKQQRTSVSLDIDLKGSSGNRIARISDISLGGCFIDCVIQMQTGEKVSFEINFSENEKIELTGIVMYVFSGVGFGVQFMPLPEDTQIILEHIILMNNGNPWGEDEPANHLLRPAA